MTVSVWRLAADTKDHKADDISGEGAKRTGGRWNPAGLPVVYASITPAMAYLETVVHFNAGALPLNRYLVRIDVPDDVWRAARRTAAAELPGWDDMPAGRTSVEYGAAWLRSLSSALMLVPSVILPEETNVLVNPRHPEARRIAAVKTRRIAYDPRLTR